MKRSFLLAALCMLLLPAFADAQENCVKSQWEGARVVILGDSISDPGSGDGSTHYYGYLRDMMGIDSFSLGVSGAQVIHLYSQLERLEKDYGNKFDAMLIFIGTNDFDNSVALGEWFSYTTENIHGRGGQDHGVLRRDFVMDDSTFRGRLNRFMSTVKKKFPDKQIILLTTPHRGFACFSETNVQPAENYANNIGCFIDEYVDAVRQCASIWSVPLIDLYGASGLFPLYGEYAPYFANEETDMLHPSDLGHHRLASLIMYQLLALPCKF